jgi:hypothetical protein
VVPSADVHAAPLVQRAREAAAEAERRALRAEGAAAERAAIIAALRAWAEDGGDPWMAHCADRIAAGEHLPPAGGPK